MDSFSNSDNLWILIAAALVFFMQAGFKVLETGFVKSEHRTGIGVKNLLDWVAGSLTFFLVGFGLMFGDSLGGVVGTSFFFWDTFDSPYGYVFFIFQLAFAGTALTIVSGAMSGRTAVIPYFVASLLTAVIVYPIFGHWAWGNLFLTENKAWLADIGFMDFAGSTVVHSVGAWVGLIGIWMVGPRLGRFSASGKIQSIKASDYSYSVLGLMILWLGWWGFNGGSTLAFDGSVPKIILNTNLAAAAACFAAYFHAKIFQKNKDLIEKLIGGALTGLVAITACCNVVSPTSSVIIGLLAGLVHNFGYVIVGEKWKLDDPVGAIPVHGFGGVFGTLCVALFGDAEMLVHGRWEQLGVQFFGTVVCMVFSMAVAFVIFKVVKSLVGLRVSPQEEKEGITLDNSESISEIDDEVQKVVAQVSVQISEKAYNLFTAQEYLGMSRDIRVEMIKNNRVQYLDENGGIISPVRAIRYLAGLLEEKLDQSLTQKDLIGLTANEEQAALIGNVQSAMMGEESDLIAMFNDSFVFKRSNKGVSSDFYWHAKEKGYSIIVAGTSSGDDVQNAFVSALSISLLNELVGLKKVIPPERLLAFINEKIILSNNSKSAKEYTVHMSIIVVNPVAKKVYYANSGTNVKLFWRNDEGEMKDVKGLDMPLGKVESSNMIKRITLPYASKDCFYLATNGIYNQLSPEGKRFSQTRMRNILATNSDKTMMEQKLLLSLELDAWQESEKQTEEVLMLGFRV